MTAALNETAADPRRIIADLQRELDARTAERDAALARETAATVLLQNANNSVRASEERHSLVTQAVAEGIYDWDIAPTRSGCRRA